MVELSFRGEFDVYIPLRFHVDSSIQDDGRHSFICRNADGTPLNIHCSDDRDNAVATYVVEELRA